MDMLSSFLDVRSDCVDANSCFIESINSRAWHRQNFLALEVIPGQLFFNKTWFKLYYIIVEHPRYKMNIQDTITYNTSYPGSDSKPRACPKVTSKRLVLLMPNTLYHCGLFRL